MSVEAYDNVILHRLEHDTEIFRKDNSVIQYWVEEFCRFKWLYHSLLSSKSWIFCEDINEVDSFTLDKLAERLLERLERKSKPIAALLLTNNDWR
jgi:hypothetical protein